MKKTWSQVELIREAFHYQSRFDGSTMVFKIDFPVTEHPLFPSLVKDLALLNRTGFKVVIVPGAKEWIDRVLLQNSIEPRYHRSIRISSGETMPFVQMAAFHSATRFMTGFSSSRSDAVIGNFIRARGLGVVDGIDMEHTGTVDRFYLESLRRVLDLGVIPLLPCIGWSSAGRPYNVPSDEIALEAAISLKAIKLFIISLSPGVTKEAYTIPAGIETSGQGRILRLTPQEAERVLEANRDKAKDRALEELDLAVKASLGGIDRVHIVDGSEEGAVLKELFSNLEAGTMIYADQYESIRSIRSRDIPDLIRLMEPLMQEGTLLWRSPEDIESKRQDYAVFDIDGRIRATGALHLWGDQGEIAAIATDPAYAEMGLGRALVNYFIDQAKKQGLKRVFVLTTKTQDWFESLGFIESPVESLPEEKLRIYDRQRASKVFALDL
ncbi:MAG: amino-acid N-acetyltransferase [Treponema sp.]|nr:amino-acid N-acetyltransferase [Treponema sp.]